MSIDVRIDFFAIAGHKNLLGPSGVGVMYVKNEEVKHIIEGGTGNSSHSAIHPEVLPNKFEAGTVNYLDIAGLNAALDYIANIGINKIYDKSMSLTQYFIEKLSKIKELIFMEILILLIRYRFYRLI